MDFEAYLISKKIDSEAFRTAEPDMWNSWSAEFKVIHPNSFTAQKLYLINPVRRKYPLKQQPVPKEPLKQTSQSPGEPPAQDAGPAPSNPKPSIPRPVFKPKPKMN